MTREEVWLRFIEAQLRGGFSVVHVVATADELLVAYDQRTGYAYGHNQGVLKQATDEHEDT